MTQSHSCKMVDLGRIVAFFQPVLDLRAGDIVGYEALARLEDEGDFVCPDRFLPKLGVDDRLALFSTMVRQALAFLLSLPGKPDRYVAVNVEVSTMLQPGFVDLVAFLVADSGCRPAQLVLELLEGEQIVDSSSLTNTAQSLRALGVVLALDDIGSAYASLTNIKNLPIGILKLDREFLRRIGEAPTDLQFVASLLGLARGLNRELIVEGAETLEILEALKILGVRYAQGYAIARPMPAALALRFEPPGASSDVDYPLSLLGVYASHLVIVEACRRLAEQPLKFRWHRDASDPHACCIGRFLDRHGLHETTYGRAHKRFHHSLVSHSEGGAEWRVAAEEMRCALVEALERDHASPSSEQSARQDPVMARASRRRA